MALAIFDTDILIDAGRGDADAAACLRRVGAQSAIAVSAVTQMELIVGCRNKAELIAVDKFLARFQILKISERISDKAIDLLKQYRMSHGLWIADALIAAAVLDYNTPFWTKNQRDFRFIVGVNLQPYP